MEAGASPPPQYTSYKMEPQQIHADPDKAAEPARNPNFAFTRAAFAFRDGLDHKKQATATVKPVEASSPEPEPDPEPTDQEIEEAAHQQRHKKRIRIARTIQHIITSILSIGVAVLQGLMYVSFQRTKNVPGAWPEFPNLLPTLMLFVTAIVSLFIDVCALVAYLWPSSGIGRRAFKLANSANNTIKTFKSITYTYSAIVCGTSFNQGMASGQNSDLWSWSCSPKGDAQAHVTNANANCKGAYVAWYLSFGNIAAEVIGMLIDQYMARDQDKFKNTKQIAPEILEMRLAKAKTAGSDAKPLLGDAGAMGMGGKPKYQKLTDDEYTQLDDLQKGYDGELTTSTKAYFDKNKSK